MPTPRMGPRSQWANTGAADRSWPHGGASQKLLTQQMQLLKNVAYKSR